MVDHPKNIISIFATVAVCVFIVCVIILTIYGTVHLIRSGEEEHEKQTTKTEKSNK